MSTLPLLGRVSNLGRLPIHGRPDNWTTLGRVQSSVSLDFTSASIDATLASLGFVFARASTATRINASGVMESVASGAMRIEHDPVTGAPLGYLCEETSTNRVRNSTMVGVVAGSPGTLPTNWSLATAGLTGTVVGAGVESGVPYVDVRLSGTATSGLAQMLLDANTAIGASASQAWTQSVYLRLVGGSLANVNSISPGIVYRNAGGTSLASDGTAASVTAGALIVQRRSHTSTSPASTSYAQGSVNLSVVNGGAVDITLRIGAPQLEQKAFATSYIPTAGAAVTRLSDALRCSALGAWFLQSAGSLVVRARGNPGVGARVLMEFGTSGANLDRYGLQVYTPGVIRASGVTGGIANDATTANAITTGSNFVAAGAYDASGKAAVLNGGSVVVSATGIPLREYSILDIGRATWDGAYFNGVIQMVAYYPRRLSNAELQSITT